MSLPNNEPLSPPDARRLIAPQKRRIFRNIFNPYRLAGLPDDAGNPVAHCELRVLADFPGFARDNAVFCAGPGIGKDALKVLEAETLRASPGALAALAGCCQTHSSS